jgi:hypothetical protein
MLSPFYFAVSHNNKPISFNKTYSPIIALPTWSSNPWLKTFRVGVIYPNAAPTSLYSSRSVTLIAQLTEKIWAHFTPSSMQHQVTLTERNLLTILWSFSLLHRVWLKAPWIKR